MEDISVPVQYECQLSIPGTEYLVSQKILYDPGKKMKIFFKAVKVKKIAQMHFVV
jgi:hypothetical protein